MEARRFIAAEGHDNLRRVAISKAEVVTFLANSLDASNGERLFGLPFRLNRALAKFEVYCISHYAVHLAGRHADNR